MGDKLISIMQQIEKEYGKIALFRVILHTKITKDTAILLEDSEENIEKLNITFKKIFNKNLTI